MVYRVYTYDRDNRVTGIPYDGGSHKVNYTYDELGRVTTRVAECGVTAGKLTSVYEYVNDGYGTYSTTPLVKKITQNGISFQCAYDTRGNIISEKRNGIETTYAYDALGQLIRVNDPHENTTWVYNYDRGGNITSKVKYAYTTGTLGTAQETIPYVYGDSNWKDKLTSYNGQTITYDAIGNPSNDGTWTYEWRAGRQLKRMSKADMSVEFKYDHNGLRTQKKVTENGAVTTTDYIYHGKLLTHITIGNDSLHFLYDTQSRPAKTNFNGAIYTYVHNIQSDIVGIFDNAGTLVVEYKYDTWGKLLATTGSLAGTLGKCNPFRYRGYVYDEETGLHYLKNRYGNSEINRFVNADMNLGQAGTLSHHVFAYCKNNAMMGIDPHGKSTEWQFALRHPFIASYIGKYVEGKRCTNITTTAIRFAVNLKLKQPESANKEGTQVNALRHALWTGIISRFYGKTIAREAVRSHEDEEMLELGDSLLGKSAMEISAMVFSCHAEADSMCDILNNEIALQMSWNKETPHEICSAVLAVYHNDGLWVINENGCNGGFSIYKECLSEDAYNTAMHELAFLDDYGFAIE